MNLKAIATINGIKAFMMIKMNVRDEQWIKIKLIRARKFFFNKKILLLILIGPTYQLY